MSPQRTPVRHWLLGDWGTLIRDPIDLLRLVFPVAAVVAAATGDIGAALRLLFTFGLVLLCRVLDPPRPFDLGFVLGMYLQAFGNAFSAFTTLGWYDKVVHFWLPFFAAPLFYLLLVRLGAVPDLAEERPRSRRYAGIIIVTFALGLAFGALYEIYEYLAVHWLRANLQVGYADTIGDLLDDAVASLLGGALLVVWSHFGWGTVRRTPEETLERLRARGDRPAR